MANKSKGAVCGYCAINNAHQGNIRFVPMDGHPDPYDNVGLSVTASPRLMSNHSLYDRAVIRAALGVPVASVLLFDWR